MKPPNKASQFLLKQYKGEMMLACSIVTAVGNTEKWNSIRSERLERWLRG